MQVAPSLFISPFLHISNSLSFPASHCLPVVSPTLKRCHQQSLCAPDTLWSHTNPSIPSDCLWHQSAPVWGCRTAMKNEASSHRRTKSCSSWLFTYTESRDFTFNPVTFYSSFILDAANYDLHLKYKYSILKAFIYHGLLTEKQQQQKTVQPCECNLSKYIKFYILLLLSR